MCVGCLRVSVCALLLEFVLCYVSGVYPSQPRSIMSLLAGSRGVGGLMLTRRPPFDRDQFYIGATVRQIV